MDILFQNEYKRDNLMAREVYFYYFYKRPFYIIADFALALAFVVNTVLALSGGKPAVILFIAAPLCYLGQFLMYRETVKMLTRRDKSNYGDEPPLINTVITDDCISYTVASEEAEKTSLSSIRSAVKTRNFILLITSSGLIYSIKKDGFTAGSADKLTDFLSEKGIMLK